MHTLGTPLTIAYWLSIGKKILTWSNKEKNNYYIVSGRNNTIQYLFEVKAKPEVFCNKPVQVYPTNYNSLYVVIDFGGFDLASGKRMGVSGETQHL